MRSTAPNSYSRNSVGNLNKQHRFRSNLSWHKPQRYRPSTVLASRGTATRVEAAAPLSWIALPNKGMRITTTRETRSFSKEERSLRRGAFKPPIKPWRCFSHTPEVLPVDCRGALDNAWMIAISFFFPRSSQSMIHSFNHSQSQSTFIVIIF